jgi:hypothetical protein
MARDDQVAALEEQRRLSDALSRRREALDEERLSRHERRTVFAARRVTRRERDDLARATVRSVDHADLRVVLSPLRDGHALRREREPIRARDRPVGGRLEEPGDVLLLDAGDEARIGEQRHELSHEIDRAAVAHARPIGPARELHADEVDVVFAAVAARTEAGHAGAEAKRDARELGAQRLRRRPPFEFVVDRAHERFRTGFDR